MGAAKAKTVRMLLVVVLALGAGIGLAAAQTQQAYAYTYLKTDTVSIFNRHWIKANSSGYFEEIGADPNGPNSVSYVNSYRYSIYNATDGRGWWDYYCTSGSWERAGARMGHGVPETASADAIAKANAAGFGCVATYGYAWSREGYFTGANGLDDLYYSHIRIDHSFWGDNYYGAADFWPRVKIQYDKNTAAAVGSVPGSHYKYIGNAGNVSSVRPTRTGYTFEGWSTIKAGPVNIAPGQRIGYEDWNLKKPMTLAHGWSSGPTGVYDDLAAGIPSPSGTNVITLYAQWKPISYTVAYAGNGATSGSTASSSHVFDASKALTPNGFARSYSLTCDAQGGSAGNKTLTCAWTWKSWNTVANGGGSSYANKASVRNLRSTVGTTTLYAQWNAGKTSLPSPGTKAGYRFKGWYTAPSGGALVGQAGIGVSVGKNTTYYAQWLPDVKVSYYVDGSTAPVFSETVPNGSVHQANPQAKAKGTKSGCAGFDGWYLDAACTKAYQGGVAVPERGLNLYGRNKVSLSYGLTDRTRALFDGRVLYVDEALSSPISAEDLIPPDAMLHYGDRVSFKRGQSAWIENHGRVREATCEPGVYSAPDATTPPSDSVRLTCNTHVYLQWSLPAYDGIALS